VALPAELRDELAERARTMTMTMTTKDEGGDKRGEE
jgi:hypothetical protein